MKGDDQTLEVEITIAPAKGRKGGLRRTAGGPSVPDPARIPRIARLMALAIKFQDMVHAGEVRDYADIARLGYVSRARLTQIMNMLNLAPVIQESILFMDSLKPNSPATEHALRRTTSLVLWEQQIACWPAVQPKIGCSRIVQS